MKHEHCQKKRRQIQRWCLIFLLKRDICRATSFIFSLDKSMLILPHRVSWRGKANYHIYIYIPPIQMPDTSAIHALPCPIFPTKQRLAAIPHQRQTLSTCADIWHKISRQKGQTFGRWYIYMYTNDEGRHKLYIDIPMSIDILDIYIYISMFGKIRKRFFIPQMRRYVLFCTWLLSEKRFFCCFLQCISLSVLVYSIGIFYWHQSIC